MVEVVQPAAQTVRCACGALLKYGVRDVKHHAPPVHQLATHMGVFGGWPHITCPECDRAVLVSGCW